MDDATLDGTAVSGVSAKAVDEISLDQAKTGGSMGFLPVDTSLLSAGPERAFDLYKRVHGDMVLLCAHDYPLTRRILNELRKGGEQESCLYIPAQHGQALSHHVECALQRTMGDRTLDVERRSRILHGSALVIMSEILENPKAAGVVRRGIGLANATVSFMLEEPHALRSMSALFTKDYYTYTHSVHVCVLGVALYKYLISPKVSILRRVGLGLLLHDTGKSIVDQAILNKNGRLTDQEFDQMKAHPALGWQVLHTQGTNDELIKQVVLHHHERVDGSGYPAGLQGLRLSEEARIAALVDVYDALTTDRPYRGAMTHDDAMELIAMSMVPHHLDDAYFAAFERVTQGFGE